MANSNTGTVLIDRFAWLLIGGVAGVIYGKYTSPAPIPCTEPGTQPVTQSLASGLLTVGRYVQNPQVRPVLVDLSQGRAPTLQEMYQATRAFT